MWSRIIAADDSPPVRPVSWRRLMQQDEPGVPEPDPVITELQDKLAQTEKFLELRSADSWQAGYQAGVAEARKETDRALRPLLDNMASQLGEFGRARTELLTQAEESLTDLAFAVARRVLHRELTLDPGAVSGIVDSALRKLRTHHILKIRVHPRLEAAVRTVAEREEILSGATELCTDRTLETDSLIFETDRGNLDASIDTQLDEIRRGLTDGMGR